MDKAKDPYNNALIISYEEGDFSLERSQLALPDSSEDILHTVRDEEKLTDIAQNYYGDGKYWYVIADRNNILDIFTLETGTKLIITHRNNL